MKLAHWPLYGLRLRTPRLELRLPTLEELDALAEVSAQGVHEPGQMPFLVPWSDLPPAERARGVMQHHWRMLADWTPDQWNLQLVIFRDGEVLGAQNVSGKDFAVLRQVESGSWLGRRHQGQGVGTEMRAAMLHLAFAGLGAEIATTGAFTDNPASAAVSRKLGYRPSGMARGRQRDTLGHVQLFTLDRAGWERHRRVPVEIEGLAECRKAFGLG